MNSIISAEAHRQVDRVIAAGYPVIAVETWEEERLERLLAKPGEDSDRPWLPVWTWSAATGFRSGPGADRDLRDPAAALEFVAREGHEALCLLLDLPSHFPNQPGLQRAVRDVYDALSNVPGALVMTHPFADLPPALGKELYLLRLPLPDVTELRALLEAMNDALPDGEGFDARWLENASEAMRGISSNEARDLFKRLVAERVADLEAATEVIRNLKAQLLMKENCLEVMDARLNLDQIGGLHNLKQWIVSRHRLFGAEAQQAGIDPPSGVLMMGVSGCGKSLASKVIPAAWGLPLIRLDMNLVMSGAWGSPETAWERALRTTESAAPVVLWIDEIENSFGYSNGAVSGGNMTIFSSFLTWMQEKPKDVFVVATANKIEMLPAEMLRKGRFDQLFFLDLPKTEARIEILRIHILNQRGDPEQFDLPHLAELVDGWTAAEIEQMVRAARLDAFYESRQFAYDDLMKNSFRMVPLSKTMSEQINELRRWSHKRASPAD